MSVSEYLMISCIHLFAYTLVWAYRNVSEAKRRKKAEQSVEYLGQSDYLTVFFLPSLPCVSVYSSYSTLVINQQSHTKFSARSLSRKILECLEVKYFCSYMIILNIQEYFFLPLPSKILIILY